MGKINFNHSFVIIEKIGTLLTAVLIPIVLLGVLVLSFIYLFTLIYLQPYAVYKDI